MTALRASDEPEKRAKNKTKNPGNKPPYKHLKLKKDKITHGGQYNLHKCTIQPATK